MSKTQITPTLEWDEVFDCAVAAWCRSSTSQEMLRMCFQSRTQQNEVSVGWTANELMAFATGIARLVASPTPPAEQQAQPGAVYAELHEPDATTVGLGAVWNRHSMRDFADRTHALRMQAAPKAASEVGNSGFDHKTAADFLNGKTVSDEAVRKFVQASRWAHDEKAALSAMLLSERGVLASREAEIALLKKALLEAETATQQDAQEPIGHLRTGPKEEFVATKRAEELGIDVWHPVFTAQPAPKQEVQEPHGWLYEWTHSSATGKPDSTYTAFTTDEEHARKHDNCRAIYTAPQPAPVCHHRPLCVECAAIAAQEGTP